MIHFELTQAAQGIEFQKWVENIGDKHNEPFSAISTESLRGSTDSEEKPSIFVSDYPRFVYFDHTYRDSDFRVRKSCRGWQFVAFMRRWFKLDFLRYYRLYFEEKEHLVRGYYQGGGYYGYHGDTGKELFREYLLINSCILVFAILLFQNVGDGIEILSGKKEKRRDPKDQRSIEFDILYRYIMENPMKIKLQMLGMQYQIPLFIVEYIYTNVSNLSELVGTPIDKLALSCFDDLYPRVHKSKVHGGTGTLPPGGFKHLLHIFHWSRTPEGMFLAERRSLQSIKKMGDFYIPSATNLQLSETVFQKHAGDSMIDMSFYDRTLSGEMHLTPWYLLQYSTELYEDLLTFERHYVDYGLPFMTYVACMACLLNTEEDVRVLRASGIIQSMRFDNNDVLARVVKLKTMIDDYVSMPNELVILEEKVMEHDQRSSSRVYGEFKRHYCSNPWVIVSVIGGILLFVYTFIQTLYGALSYYKK